MTRIQGNSKYKSLEGHSNTFKSNKITLLHHWEHVINRLLMITYFSVALESVCTTFMYTKTGQDIYMWTVKNRFTEALTFRANIKGVSFPFITY